MLNLTRGTGKRKKKRAIEIFAFIYDWLIGQELTTGAHKIVMSFHVIAFLKIRVCQCHLKRLRIDEFHQKTSLGY